MHLELAPPPAQGLGRSLSLALVVHVMLLIALTWGIQWQNMDNTPAVEAELWSALPKAAAPPPPPPAPEPTPEPPPPPPVTKVKPTPPPASRDADIAIAKQKKVEQEQKLVLEQLKLKKQAEQKEKALEQERQREKEKLAQAQRDKKEQAVKEQKEKERKDKERKEQEAKRAAQDDRKLQKLQEDARKDMMSRMAGAAGATGSPSATGDALRASGPSASYGGRIIARVKPNIVFNPDDVSGNPVAEVEVRTAPDGKIMSRKLIKSSGNKAWDETVIKALDKTDTLPRDTDGTIPTMMVLGFKPRD